MLCKTNVLMQLKYQLVNLTIKGGKDNEIHD